MIHVELTLVGCCGEKLGRIAPARQLYQSQLFRLSSTYAENIGRPWYVISAAYGLIRSDDQLAPYDLSMNSLTVDQRHKWARDVAAQLDALRLFHDAETLDVVLLAGESYATWVPIVSDWCTVSQPLRGMQIGQRLQWLNSKMKAPDLFPEAA